MTASSGPGARTRLDRARSIVAELRASVPDVPAGLSGLTDRVLPYAFPTLDEQTFSETLARQRAGGLAAAAGGLGRRHELRAALRAHARRVLHAGHRASHLRPRHRRRDTHRHSWNGGCKLLVVRVGSAADRIYAANGKVDAAYRPESTAADTVEPAGPRSGLGGLLGGRRRRRRSGAEAPRRRRPEPPGRDGADRSTRWRRSSPRSPRRCCARPRPALSSAGGGRLTRSEASKGRHGWGLEEDWWSGSASKRPCRAHACARGPGCRNRRRRLLVGEPSGGRDRRLARIRPHGRQQPLLAADGHHAGERRPARPRLHQGLPRDRSRHEARPAVVPARDRRHALRDDERCERLRDRRRDGEDPLAAQAARTARSSRTSASPPTAASRTAAASSSSSSST